MAAATVRKQIDAFIAAQPEARRADVLALHRRIRKLLPKGKLWFLDGRDDSGKTVTNPNIGYGALTMTYAGGKTREFYNIGLAPNATGISVYVMGIKDKKHLPQTYAKTIGKASVTGYCIRFGKLDDIDLDVLDAAIRDGVKAARAA